MHQRRELPVLKHLRIFIPIRAAYKVYRMLFDKTAKMHNITYE